MGQRITQGIEVCDLCGKTPEDGEFMWKMGMEVWCADCIEEQEMTDETEDGS